MKLAATFNPEPARRRIRRLSRVRATKRFAVAALAVLLCAAPAVADPRPTPDPAKLNARLHAAAAPLTLPPTIRLPKLPTAVLHTEFVVEVNKRGQVTRVRSGKGSSNPGFNLKTYGNALQAYIRTENGRSVPGVFRLTYDYSPVTKNVTRGVALIRRGGVNVNAPGAVQAMMEASRKHVSPIPKATKRS